MREAGAMAMQYFREEIRHWRKTDDTLVTEADIEIDELLLERLTSARPDYGWLSEETRDNAERLTQNRVWVVDPIDGTIAFFKGRPHFSVSVALVVEGAGLIAGVYNPATDEFFAACKDVGACRNGAPIQVSDCAAVPGCRMLGAKDMFAHPAWPEPWPAMEIENRNSIAYRLCLVAAGEFDAALVLSTKCDWDVAAADLIVREAGGRCTTHDGQALVFNRESPRQRSILAAGPRLYEALFARVGAIVLPSERPAESTQA